MIAIILEIVDFFMVNRSYYLLLVFVIYFASNDSFSMNFARFW